MDNPIPKGGDRLPDRHDRPSMTTAILRGGGSACGLVGATLLAAGNASVDNTTTRIALVVVCLIAMTSLFLASRAR